MKRIELLAPAKNYEYGVAAIDSGADAIYIGGPKFGARYGAVNSMDDIKRVTEYAHKFGVKVFVTLNTILFEQELTQAREIAQELSEIGVDALIVQDMAYSTFGLDVPLHASTQAASLTVERALFFEKIGFERVILERAMSLDDIKAIREKTTVELEAFVHGAICVSYSGQCYMGHILSERSGNRGVCSQACRSTYTLRNERGEILIKDKHLLSLLDLNLSDYIPDMIDSGVTSFKIEGRLKDISYLKNSVAYYRKVIDKVIAERGGELKRASLGQSVIKFEPNPIKTFSRRFTPYFINGKTKDSLISLHTAKALGEEVGEVKSVKGRLFTVDTDLEFVGGDGICFIDDHGKFWGTNINKYSRSGKTVSLEPNVIDNIKVGNKVYRNSDKRFIDEVTRSVVSRKLDIILDVNFNSAKPTISCGEVSVVCDDFLEPANNREKGLENIITNFKKCGDSIFNVTEVRVEGEIKFMPISMINSLRRELFSKLESKLLSDYKRNNANKIVFEQYYEKKLSYKANVSNSLAREFYNRCGVEVIEDAVELSGIDMCEVDAMTTRYCIRREIGECLKEGGRYKSLTLEDESNRFDLRFDCKKCEMKVVYYCCPGK